ncbi:HDOD domain-containing protein [Pseudoalteromonas spongiae]|uniref:HDOD domain-containing protein n=1 Tax=Pseudoalteromonas spongiae TaxID=298657 RepID=UPI00026CB7A8|nr:HDOD domain-containing protein [Pseudoalteromonas spongiae]ATD00716.1 hypothetical protein PSPO_b0752 [Pseudoalteromonas spongiae UST010723-006]
MATRQASPQEQVSDLPILPTILVELLSIPLDDKDYFNKIEKLAERDPPLALKIIQLSNTAKQAAIKPIRSIKDAIVRMGTKEVFNLINLVALTKVFVPTSQFEKQLWRQSLISAELLKTTYDVLLRSVITADMAYLVGLLHDIDITLNHKLYAKYFESLDDLTWYLPKPYEKHRIAYLQRQHAFNGAKICKTWHIPSPIPEIIYFHHHDNLPDKFKQFMPLLETIRRVQFCDLTTQIYFTHQALELDVLNELIASNEILLSWQNQHANFAQLLNQLPTAISLAEEKYRLLAI